MSKKTTEKAVVPTPIFVYVGPSLPNGQLKKSTIFKCSREEALKYLEPVTEKYPEVVHLLVSIDQMADARGRISQGGNLMAMSYAKLAAANKKK